MYVVSLRYDARRHPTVRVVNPALVPNGDDELPHICPDGSLCLYRPGEWTWGDPLAKTVIPWACEWLFHYEVWRATGEWSGSGGNHTGPVTALTDTRPSTGRRGGRTRRR